MIDIPALRKINAQIITLGSHPGIMQSILDFDFLSGKERPSISAILATGRHYERYFFGEKEILIPVYSSSDDVPEKIKQEIQFFLNLASGRRTEVSTNDMLDSFPNIIGGVVFAENVPEQHALTLSTYSSQKKKFIIGPASIGLLIPGVLKLGAIGGVEIGQLVDAQLFSAGSVAVFSASGGMTNEIINTVTRLGKRISFSLSFGGERFPITSPKDAFLAAQNDPETKAIVYFGELGGVDEYDLSQLLIEGKITKKTICYIGGTVAEMFETPPQFGHAKALAKNHTETARGKRDMLKKAGAMVAESYSEFLSMIEGIEEPIQNKEKEYSILIEQMNNRRTGLITTSVSADIDGQPHLLGQDLMVFAKNHSFAAIVGSLFLGKEIQSKEFEEFIDFVLRLLVDHGPYVSGAVNTIITARAGRDLPSSLATGLLTIGPRFGGAINQAAANWLSGVSNEKDPSMYVEEFAKKRQYIAGIGHKKYRVDLPDPRVIEIKKFADHLLKKRFTNFALSIEKVTAAKKGNLILNVDGAIAAVLLDLLSEKEGMSDKELQKLTEIEFFNALFILSRSVGFISHFLDQKRLDEGIFRLGEEHVVTVDSEH